MKPVNLNVQEYHEKAERSADSVYKAWRSQSACINPNYKYGGCFTSIVTLKRYNKIFNLSPLQYKSKNTKLIDK